MIAITAYNILLSPPLFLVPHPLAWPDLSLDSLQDTCTTLHLWTQIVGKIRLGHAPWTNHSWHVPLYPTVRGLSTSAMYSEGRAFEIVFDFAEHALVITTAEGEREVVALEAMPVSRFYDLLFEALRRLRLEAQVWPQPVEIEGAVPFPEDDAPRVYAPEAAAAYWRALLQAQRVFTIFRSRFTGKVSPVHFFWGAFDLAVTRFSGRRAPTHPGGAPHLADWVMQESYSHEVSSAGFWPGKDLGGPSFYSYAYPQPEGYAAHPVQPEAAHYHTDLGEFVLPYEAVRTAPNPDAVLLAFLQSTYEAAADLASWDREALEWDRPPDSP